MANGQILLVLCLGMLSSLKIVLGGDNNVSIYIPDDYVHHVEDTTLNRMDGTITVTREAVGEFKCVKDELNDRIVLSTLETKVKAKEIKIQVIFGGHFYEFGTITNVEPVYPKGFHTSGNRRMQDFKFTYSLYGDRTEWSPCVFANNYFGFRHKERGEILLTYTPDVIGDLKLRSSKDWICMRDIDKNGNAYENNPDYVIHDLKDKSDEDVLRDVKAYILSYSALSKLQPI